MLAVKIFTSVSWIESEDCRIVRERRGKYTCVSRRDNGIILLYNIYNQTCLSSLQVDLSYHPHRFRKYLNISYDRTRIRYNLILADETTGSYFKINDFVININISYYY